MWDAQRGKSIQKYIHSSTHFSSWCWTKYYILKVVLVRHQCVMCMDMQDSLAGLKSPHLPEGPSSQPVSMLSYSELTAPSG